MKYADLISYFFDVSSQTYYFVHIFNNVGIIKQNFFNYCNLTLSNLGNCTHNLEWELWKKEKEPR